MANPLLSAIEKLPLEEQLDLVQSVWERLSADPDAVPVREEDLVEVRLSLAEHQAHPEAAEPWESVRRNVAST